MVQLHEVRARYLEAALLGDRPLAASIVASLLSDGHDPETLVSDLLQPVQLEVGERWQRQLLTVGHEHTVTCITEAILSSITVGFEPQPDRGHLVLSCAEGEYHSLAARMASELLILQGWRVTFLGTATPATHLRRYVDEIDADAVGISCSVAMNLPGAARSIAAARAAGHTVIVGGRGFGDDATRASRLGADGWVASLDAGLDLGEVLLPEVAEADDDGEWADLDQDRPVLVEAALAWLRRHRPRSVGALGALRHPREDLDETLRFTVASLLTGDPTVLSDYRSWLEDVHGHRVAPSAADLGFEALAAVCASGHPRAAAALQDATAHGRTARRRAR